MDAEWAEWNGDQLLAAVGDATASALGVAGEKVSAAAAALIDEPYPPASPPGSPPHRRTGTLHDATAAGHVVVRDGADVELRVSVGSAPYAAAVAARRPWLTQSLVEGLADEIVGTVETSVARSL